MPTRFHFNDLLLVTKIAESRSLSQGAYKAHVSTPAASHRIKQLEESLGVQLLNRTSQGVTLTVCGQAFARRARSILQQLDDLDADIRGYAKGNKGRLRVWAGTVAFEYLPKVIESFVVARDDVDVELRERRSLDIVQAIAQGRIDVGVISGPADSEHVRMIPFQEERLVLVTPASHDVAKRESIAFEDIIDASFVGLWEENNLSPFLAEEASLHGVTLRLSSEAANAETACRMVEAGIGVAVLPERAARRYERDFEIAIVPLSNSWAVRPLKICIRKGESISPLAQEFIRLLQSSTSGRNSGDAERLVNAAADERLRDPKRLHRLKTVSR